MTDHRITTARTFLIAAGATVRTFLIAAGATVNITESRVRAGDTVRVHIGSPHVVNPEDVPTMFVGLGIEQVTVEGLQYLATAGGPLPVPAIQVYGYSEAGPLHAHQVREDERSAHPVAVYSLQPVRGGDLCVRLTNARPEVFYVTVIVEPLAQEEPCATSSCGTDGRPNGE